ncbi:putative major ampullate spidroin 1 [Magnetofaba australis IT-1]|uniref:Putative major ampullate spidroin 1 n=1 Tax=Magnetofaba australis IT-1 TaxID=1434232 RepID=A0A1Y2KBG1_9PROT|nr:putative major ampullate spidroin 1 [Magnetofaba australis IT-1]
MVSREGARQREAAAGAHGDIGARAASDQRTAEGGFFAHIQRHVARQGLQHAAAGEGEAQRRGAVRASDIDARMGAHAACDGDVAAAAVGLAQHHPRALAQRLDAGEALALARLFKAQQVAIGRGVQQAEFKRAGQIQPPILELDADIRRVAVHHIVGADSVVDRIEGFGNAEVGRHNGRLQVVNEIQHACVIGGGRRAQGHIGLGDEVHMVQAQRQGDVGGQYAGGAGNPAIGGEELRVGGRLQTQIARAIDADHAVIAPGGELNRAAQIHHRFGVAAHPAMQGDGVASRQRAAQFDGSGAVDGDLAQIAGDGFIKAQQVAIGVADDIDVAARHDHAVEYGVAAAVDHHRAVGVVGRQHRTARQRHAQTVGVDAAIDDDLTVGEDGGAQLYGIAVNVFGQAANLRGLGGVERHLTRAVGPQEGLIEQIEVGVQGLLHHGPGDDAAKHILGSGGVDGDHAASASGRAAGDQAAQGGHGEARAEVIVIGCARVQGDVARGGQAGVEQQLSARSHLDIGIQG